ncbi:MAG TPA: hypothetical protein VMS64_21985 [Candidatus Methylomirabilis sp.]|nr:hypothetical protein [Candidatus Methylomirabilis sp.]
MRLSPVLGIVTSILLVVATAGAQPAGDTPQTQSRAAMWAPSPPVQWRNQTVPLLADILDQRAQLALSPAQVESIEQVTIDFAREVIRRQADRQIATLDLAAMLEPALTVPAKPLDLTRVEAKIREIERIDGDVELAYLRAIEAGKAQLSAEQRTKLEGILAGDDPPGFTPTAGHSGGGAGHPGGGGTAPPPGGGRPTPPGGGGGPGHPPGWHGGPPQHGHGFHPGARGGVIIGAWPWYWWGYPSPLYTVPPPAPSYWYYCPAYGGYYPDVPSCPEPWVVVPAG